jgi:hypothetical protein
LQEERPEECRGAVLAQSGGGVEFWVEEEGEGGFAGPKSAWVAWLVLPGCLTD